MGSSPREKVGIQSMQEKKSEKSRMHLQEERDETEGIGNRAWNGVPERSERVNGRGQGLGPGDRRSSGVGSRTRRD